LKLYLPQPEPLAKKLNFIQQLDIGTAWNLEQGCWPH
jgi:hypothetical protein